MRKYFRYWRVAFLRAWQIAWALVIDRSPQAIVRGAILLIVSVYALWSMRGYLEKTHALPQHDNLIIETIIWATLVAVVTVVVFVTTFIFCAIFVAPFQLWNDKSQQIERLAAAITVAGNGSSPLSRDQLIALRDGISALKSVLGKWRMAYMHNDARSHALYAQLQKAFTSAGMMADGGSDVPINKDETGINVRTASPSEPSDAARALHALLAEVGLDAQYSALGAHDIGYSATIFVGQLTPL